MAIHEESLRAAKEAAVRSLILQDLNPQAAQRAVANAISVQADYWEQTLERCLRGECRHIYLYITHYEGNEFTTFLYSGDNPASLNALPGVLGQGPAIGAMAGDSGEGEEPAFGHYRVSMFDIGPDVLKTLKGVAEGL